jgi:isopentenyl-diphosphate delta-isomerase
MDNTQDALICVDLFDHPIGSCSKQEAHEKGLLHRAFSVFLADLKGRRMLIHQRAAHKYHSGGLWTNTCCSHPRAGEDTKAAARRRLLEETGIDCPVEALFSFVYRQVYENGITEYEVDHVFLGFFDGEEKDWKTDPEEIRAMAWIRWDELALSLLQEPDRYTAWFLIAAPKVLQHLQDLTRA